MMKRLIWMLGAILLAGLLMCGVASAGTVASGTCGVQFESDLTWTLDSDGVLTISGTGRMRNYDNFTYYSTTPWENYRASIKTVVINPGVTSIGSNAFWHDLYITSITIPDSVTSIGGAAFLSCTGLTNITIPDNVTYIGKELSRN